MPELTLLPACPPCPPRSTVSRKNFTTVQAFIAEPDSRAQCAALEDNVKEFGLTYFGMKDKRQGTSLLVHSPPPPVLTHLSGIVHVIGPEQGFTVRPANHFHTPQLTHPQLPGITCVCGDSHTSST